MRHGSVLPAARGQKGCACVATVCWNLSLQSSPFYRLSIWLRKSDLRIYPFAPFYRLSIWLCKTDRHNYPSTPDPCSGALMPTPHVLVVTFIILSMIILVLRSPTRSLHFVAFCNTSRTLPCCKILHSWPV